MKITEQVRGAGEGLKTVKSKAANSNKLPNGDKLSASNTYIFKP
jgi:hypothetical protein